jgi:hypothetical protein
MGQRICSCPTDTLTQSQAATTGPPVGVANENLRVWQATCLFVAKCSMVKRSEPRTQLPVLVLGSVKTWATRAELQSGAAKRRRWIP